jgi:hypothetical protein
MWFLKYISLFESPHTQNGISLVACLKKFLKGLKYLSQTLEYFLKKIYNVSHAISLQFYHGCGLFYFIFLLVFAFVASDVLTSKA